MIRGALGTAAGAVFLLCTVAAAQAPLEPSDYRTSEYRAAVPETLSGATVIDAATAEHLWREGRAVFVDVLPRPERPAELPSDTYWRAPERLAIPGSTWLANTGYGTLTPERQAYFEAGLARVIDEATPVVFYCQRNCWMSWNAAKRALELGVEQVHWFPDGTDGWAERDLPLEPLEPWSLEGANG
ncbi:PQQ-dependent catabolism-associated CXXCW motif protein [Palleronia sp.]|uniref:PQQ-dependent catabolism-associated CXXCW motif protein n=1 Tax=Palleronia sp. TaxID=1940284 RepID=UPI0035C84EBA